MVAIVVVPVLTDGNYFDVTGTTTIATINTTGGVGTLIKLHFDGILTLTHSASLVLPGGDDIVTGAGDEFEFVEFSTGLYRCTAYTLTTGQAIVGGAGGGGALSPIVQIVYLEDGEEAEDLSATAMSHDDNIPQNTEGLEVMTLAITPTSPTNILTIEVITNFSTTGLSNPNTTALFKDAIAPAIATVAHFQSASNRMSSQSLTHEIVAGSTSLQTFKVRIGTDGTDNLYFNNILSTRLFGGTMASSIRITERDPSVVGVGATDNVLWESALIDTSADTETEFDVDVPDGITQFDIIFDLVSGSSTSNPIVQLGDASSIEITGYDSVAASMQTGVASSASSAGMHIRYSLDATQIVGTMSFFLIDPATNLWTASWQMHNGALISSYGNGRKALTGPLTRVRLTTAGGSDTFDNGQFRIRSIIPAPDAGGNRYANDFRLTLTTGVPVTTTDVLTATNIFLTPTGRGNSIGLFNGSTWQLLHSAEVSTGTLTATVDKPYDVFAYNNAGVVTLETLVWTSDTVRATALVLQDGVWSKTGDLTRRYIGTFYGLFNGSTWQLLHSAEVSTGTLTATVDKPYDVFAYNNAGVVTLETLVWTSDTVRATALVLQDGVWSKTGDLTRRYIGTFYTSATDQTEDSLENRFLYNYYNQVWRKGEGTYSAERTSVSSSFEEPNTEIRCNFVLGVVEDTIRVSAAGGWEMSSGHAGIGIGVDSTTLPARGTTHAFQFSVANQPGPFGVSAPVLVAIGFHFTTILCHNGGAGTVTLEDTDDTLRAKVWNNTEVKM